MEVKEITKGINKIAIKYDILWTKEIKRNLMVTAREKGGLLTIDDIDRIFTLLLAMMET